MIRICGVVRESIVDGPGLRFTLFTQGCPHGCEGCHNPESHAMDAGYEVDAEAILAELGKNPLLKGLTLSGGDPIVQAGELIELCRQTREMGLDIILYTGYTYEELRNMWAQRPEILELLKLVDWLIDGRFVLAQRDLTLLYRGSRNQRILDMQKTLEADEPMPAELG